MAPVLFLLAQLNKSAEIGVGKMNSNLNDENLKKPGMTRYQKKETPDHRAGVRDYINLMKPGISFLLIVEAVVAYLVATSFSISPIVISALIVSGFLSSGGSAAVNHFLERDNDSRMKRTSWRPVASRKIPAGNALAFGVTAIAVSLLVSAYMINYLTAAMILAGALSYVFLYTIYLKPRTELNIVIGGIAGVFPALAGWSAGTGTLSLMAVLIGGIVFLWTPPHFWGLATKYKEDYRLAGYPMLPVNKDIRATARSIVTWSVPMLISPFVPLIVPQIGTFNPIYYIAVAVVSAVFVKIDIEMLRRPSVKSAFKAFTFSIPYLFVVLLGMVVGTFTL